MSTSGASARVRREPPRFRRVEVRRVERVAPWMLRVTFAGPELEGLTVAEPAASIRLLLPSPPARELVMPAWNGNEFLLPEGRRPTLRTLTPFRVDPGELEVDVLIVVHDGGIASEWASAANPGDDAAISGPGRGYSIDPAAPGFVIAGDETAIAAISQLLDALPRDAAADVHIEIAHPDARTALPEHPRATIRWCELPPGARPGDALVDAVRDANVDPSFRIWAAGEAAAMQRIRRNLFEDRGLARTQTTARGYWKHGRRAGSGDD